MVGRKGQQSQPSVGHLLCSLCFPQGICRSNTCKAGTRGNSGSMNPPEAPAATDRRDPMDWIGAFAVLAAVILPAGVLYWVRRRAMRALAWRQGLRYVGRPLPKSFSLRGYPLSQIRWARNVIQGEINGIPILIFDGVAGTGKGAPCCTVVAFVTGAGSFPPVNPPERMTRQRAWTAVYRFRYLQMAWALSIARIEELLDSLGRA